MSYKPPHPTSIGRHQVFPPPTNPTPPKPPTPPKVQNDPTTPSRPSQINNRYLTESPTTGNPDMDIAISSIQSASPTHPTNSNLLTHLASALLECNLDDPTGTEPEAQNIESVREAKFRFVDLLFGVVRERNEGGIRAWVDYVFCVLVAFEDRLDGVLVEDFQEEGGDLRERG